MDTRPTWTLIFEAAEELTATGRSPFRLAEVIEAVQRRDPSRGRGTIQPIVQGMTANAGAGPRSPCGTVLLRVDHGRYKLDGTDTSAAAERLNTVNIADPISTSRKPRIRLLSTAELRYRIDALAENFDDFVLAYDEGVPFLRTGQYERHRATIDRRRELGSVQAAIADSEFTRLLYETLQLWGIGRRRSMIVSLSDFRHTLDEHSERIAVLETVSLEAGDFDVDKLSFTVDALVSSLALVTNKARIVPGTKTLHHLLPDAVPPMDGAWTGSFFVWKAFDQQNHQTEILTEALRCFAEVARRTSPSRLVGEGWRTSTTKLLDNSTIAYCKAHGIGGTEAG